VGDVHYIYRHGRRIEVETLDTSPPPKKTGRHNQFVLVPQPWLSKLSAMSIGTRWLAVALLWKSFLHYDRTFACSNALLKEFGLTRWQKDKGLIELERAGMITIERAQYRSPRIKITAG